MNPYKRLKQITENDVLCISFEYLSYGSDDWFVRLSFVIKLHHNKIEIAFNQLHVQLNWIEKFIANERWIEQRKKISFEFTDDVAN